MYFLSKCAHFFTHIKSVNRAGVSGGGRVRLFVRARSENTFGCFWGDATQDIVALPIRACRAHRPRSTYLLFFAPQP